MTASLDAFAATLPDAGIARAEFARRRALVWPDALGGALLQRLMTACDKAQFVSDPVDGLGHREIERGSPAGPAIGLALRRAPLFRWLEWVTDCAPIASVEGRVVQTWPCAGDELLWHDDMNDGGVRRLGVTIALGREAYSGGAFEMRPVGQRVPSFRWLHDRPGTALIFEVSPRLEHRVRPLTAGGPRRVYTGWFTG